MHLVFVSAELYTCFTCFSKWHKRRPSAFLKPSTMQLSGLRFSPHAWLTL